MSPGIQLRWTLSRETLSASTEQQLLYVLIDATPYGLPSALPALPLNLCLVLDRSSSMRGERLMQVKEATNRIIDQLGPDDHFALITFNDRAEVVVPAQRVRNKADIKHLIGGIQAIGGTEMATGMALALQELQRTTLRRSISRLLLLTDGRTYGDEGRCVDIARRLQSRDIGLTALGIGTEWNEDLLETMAARENNRAHYITSAQEITQVFADELQRLHSIFAQNVQLVAEMRPGGLVRSLDRVRPYMATVSITEDRELCWNGKLGDWPNSDPQTFLLELVVPPMGVGEHPLLRLTLRYDLPGANLQNQVSEAVLRVAVLPEAMATYEVDATVKHWLEHLVAYRLQAGAWQDVEAGRIEEATRRLQMAGTRLFEAGEVDLARTVQDEATRLLRSGHTSDEGRKRIKYGTRGLMGKSGIRKEREA